MKTLWKSMLLAGVSSLSVGGIGSFAMAQETDAVDVGAVTVTARRREEALKDVPVAVSAFSAEKLEATGAIDITELTRSTPSLTLQVARGSNSTLISFIRGVGQQDPLWGFDAGVGLYVDDVYVARPQGAVLDIFDVSRIEVLRGPQGTLYGRNTIGGAIKYVTSRIGSEPELRLRGSLGSYGQRDLIVSGEAPLGEMFAVSGAIANYDRDGYGTNRTTGAEHYNKDVLAARASLEFTPSESLFFRFSADFVRDDSNPRHGHRELAPSPTDIYDTFAGAGDGNSVESRGVSLLGEWSLNDSVTFKSITAYRAGETDGIIDFDNTAAPTLDIPARYRDHQFTQEFQLLLEGERWNGVAGVYYMNAQASGAFDTVLGGINLTIATSGEVNTRSYAVFGDFSYDFTDRLSVSVGGRLTRDVKDGFVYRQNFTGIRSPLFGNAAAVPGLLRTNPALYTGKELDFKEFTPRFSVSYDLTPDLTAYGSWGKGFKSGGFDMRGDFVSYPNTINGYEPEFVTTVELGLKGSLFEHRLNFATAVFDSSYEDQQITTQYPSGATVASVVDNVGSSSIRGWEFEGSARLFDGFAANVMLSYIDAQFDEYLAFIPGAPGNGFACAANPPSPPTAAGCFSDVKDQRDFQNTPEWSGSASFTYTHDLGGYGEVSFTPSAAYRGDSQMFEAATPLLDQPGFWLYDASLVWTSADTRYKVGLHGKNLGGEEYRVGGYNFPGALFGNSVIGYYGPPQTVTLTLDARF